MTFQEPDVSQLEVWLTKLQPLWFFKYILAHVYIGCDNMQYFKTPPVTWGRN